MTRARYIVGLDVGGTFTDLTLHDRQTGLTRALKVPSNRAAPDTAVLAALDKAGVDHRDIGLIVHGTTVATNALLERRGARTALVTTAGFRDVIELGRTTRLVPNSLYDPYFQRPAPIIERRHRHGIAERTEADGSVSVPLDTTAVQALASQLQSEGIESVAVGFLNSFLNAEHEREAEAILREHIPFVTISSRVLNEIREFERFSATAINAYVMPVMASYVGRLTAAIGERNPHTFFCTMASHGGLLSTATVRDQPVRTILSGPAAGVAAAVHLCDATGVADLITYDMGGTSTDVALVAGARFPLKQETLLDGMVVRLPQLDIETIGAGGGSIASLDDGGSLHVGPTSAGAVPGPACYGRGGSEPTVTDANVVLGRLGDRQELGGSLRIDRSAAAAAIAPLASRAAMSVEQMAEGIVRLAVAKMAAAVYEISVARGFDPRDFTLLSYGGAGPLHACLIAEEVGIPRVLVPPMPGAFSAFGALCSTLTKDRVATLLRPLDEGSVAQAREQARAFADSLRDEFAGEEVDVERFRAELQLDMRYAGQAHELIVNVPMTVDAALAADCFEREFEREYGRRDEGRGIEIVNVRVLGRVPIDTPAWQEIPRAAGDAPAPAHRAVVVGETTVDCPVWDRSSLAPGIELSGPAIIEEMSSTTWLPPGWVVRVGRIGEMVAEQHESAARAPRAAASEHSVH